VDSPLQSLILKISQDMKRPKKKKKTPKEAEKEPNTFVVCLIKPLRRKKREMERVGNQISVINEAYWGSQTKLNS